MQLVRLTMLSLYLLSGPYFSLSGAATAKTAPAPKATWDWQKIKNRAYTLKNMAYEYRGSLMGIGALVAGGIIGYKRCDGTVQQRIEGRANELWQAWTKANVIELSPIDVRSNEQLRTPPFENNMGFLRLRIPSGKQHVADTYQQTVGAVVASNRDLFTYSSGYQQSLLMNGPAKGWLVFIRDQRQN